MPHPKEPSIPVTPRNINRSGKVRVMRIDLASLVLVTALGIGSAAYAAEPPRPAAQPAEAAPAPMDHRAMSRGSMEMGPMRCMSLSGERLAAIRADLKITKAQSPQWDSFAAAMRSNAMVMRHRTGMVTGGSLPERLEQHETMMTAHLEALHKAREAVSQLYDVLTSDQRAKAEGLLCSDLGRHGPGKTKARH